MSDQLIKGFQLREETYKHSMLMPAKVVDKYLDFANNCIAFVTHSYDFDTELMVNNQDRLWNLYIDLLNEFRTDLNIERIDSGLRNRILSKL